jgi:hypothetical protein
VNHVLIRSYRHLGSDIGFDETMRLRQELQNLAELVKANASVDSPVRCCQISSSLGVSPGS